MKVASVVGRVFRAPMLPGAYEELGTLDDVASSSSPARGRPRGARSRGGPLLPVQARRDPGGRVREHAVRAANGPPSAARPDSSRHPSQTRSSGTSTSSPITTGSATTTRRSASSSARAAASAGQATPTRRRSGTYEQLLTLLDGADARRPDAPARSSPPAHGSGRPGGIELIAGGPPDRRGGRRPPARRALRPLARGVGPPARPFR